MAQKIAVRPYQQKGGIAVLKKHGSVHFAKLANLRWKKDRRKK